jgi:type II secretory pathway component PulF
MFPSPGSLARRANFFHQLAQLTAAGLGVTGALQQLHRSPPGQEYRAPVAAALRDLAAGCTFAEALERRGDWLTPFDLAVVRAGEHSGRLEAVLQSLARHHEERAALARRLLADLAYPVLLLHAAALLLPVPELVGQGGVGAYVFGVLSVLVPLYALAALLGVLLSHRHAARSRAWMERVLHALPLVGAGRRNLALGRCAAALEALISAGVGVLEAWPLAAAASGSPALQREVAAWRTALTAGRTPAELLQQSRCFPELFARQYQTGELSGALDDSLRRLAEYHTGEGALQLRLAAQWFPRLLYGIIAAWIAWKVISFWSGYFDQIRSVL